MAERLHEGEKIFRGIPVSAGVCRGRVLLLDKTNHVLPQRTLSEAEIPGELNRLEKALTRTREQLHDVQRQLVEGVGADQGSIFDAHLLVLEDPLLIDPAVKLIRENRLNAEQAFHQAGERYVAALAKVNDPYLRERTGDMRDVISRVLNHLT